ncbi:hypothetical protein [Paenibacillus sp. B-A-8]|uniref:hypothetical protein n=1 Tax=Paenibacillus sp. B-A-8 TaxID=3400419 RepID=UPI003B019D22
MMTKKLRPLTIALLLFFQSVPMEISAAATVSAVKNDIANTSLSAKVGDLGQIEELYINNNPTNKNGEPINFVLPNDTIPQNNIQHQWMGEMIFSYRTGDSEQFPDNREGFLEVDTNKTLAAGGSTKYSDINPNNPYIAKTASGDGKKVEVNFIGQNLDSTAQRVMKGFDVKSVFDMDTQDGSMLWEITVKNKSGKYIEFGDIGLPMPWNNKYQTLSDTYDDRVTVHNFAGADSGYAYAIQHVISFAAGAAVGTKEGTYTVELIANDGQKTGSGQVTFQLAATPEKLPPEIGQVTVTQDVTNNSNLVLSGEAIPDPVHSAVFEPTLSYAWTVKQKPDGAGEITFVGGDKATAYARVSKAGTYVFTFTAADEDKKDSKDVTIELKEDTNDTYRAISLVTKKEISPILPAQVNILSDYGFMERETKWDVIDPDSYANTGEFEARGTVKDSDLEVRTTVYVVNAGLQNAALTATPSASFSGGDGYPEAMNNGT